MKAGSLATSLILALNLFTISAYAAEKGDKGDKSNKDKAPAEVACETAVAQGDAKTVEKTEATPKVTRKVWTLMDYFAADEDNLALQHPLTVANAAERVYAMFTHVPARSALDPLYKARKVKIYPMLAGEHPASGGRMVVGQEESIHQFVNFLGSIARGDRTGKSPAFPGPAGTGKTELLYVAANIAANLDKEDKYKQYSYRFQNLDKIPYLRGMFIFDRATGEPNLKYVDPDMPRSPFTLLRADMQEEVKTKLFPKIRQKWNMAISNGWTEPEPKTASILKAIFEHEKPEVANGQMDISDLSPKEYMDILSKYVVIVPRAQLRPKSEASMIRAQTDNPNWGALFASPNLSRANRYGYDNPLAIDYRGQVFQQDSGLLMIDELYRNGQEFLNIMLEITQNHIAQTDYGQPVKLDIVPVWNSNDESIEQARQDMALKASLDRSEQNPMRLLLPPNQIEAVSLFQVNISQFKMRPLGSKDIKPINFPEVYPATDSQGSTQTAYHRYALYYQAGDKEILIAPLTLNYMAWLATASRLETDRTKIGKFKDELNLVTANPGLFTDPITRLKVILGISTAEPAEKIELTRARDLLREGETGISSRDIETWLKTALNSAVENGRTTLTPRMLDNTFHLLLDRGTIKPPKDDVRAKWQNLRARIKYEMLLPELKRDVDAIVSSDGQKAERTYDEVEREFITIASKPEADVIDTDDGSEPIAINKARLAKIRAIYRTKFGRDFSPNSLLRRLRGGAQKGVGERDSQLLEAVREFLSEQDAMTADYITVLDSYYKGESNDPAVVEKAGQIDGRLDQYGYDAASWREAVAYVAQLRNQKVRTGQ